MKLTSFITTLFLLFLTSGNAQESIKWGETQKSKYGISVVRAVDANSFYVARYGMRLERYSNSKLVSEEEARSPVSARYSWIHEIIVVEGEALVFVGSRNRGQVSLSVQLYGKDCKPKGELLTIFDIEGTKPGFPPEEFDVVCSPDQQLFCAEFVKKGAKNEKDLLYYCVCNIKLKTLFQGELDAPADTRAWERSTSQLTNKGDYFIAAKTFDIVQGKGYVPNGLVFRLVTAEGTKDSEVVLEEGKSLGEFTLILSEEKFVSITGTYSDETSKIAGIYYGKLDCQTKNVICQSYLEFKQGVVGPTYNSEKVKESSEKLIARGGKGFGLRDVPYFVRNKNLLPDGSVLVLMEQFCSNTTTSQSGNQTLHQYYEDLIVYRVSESGKLMWLTKIPKRQYIYDGSTIQSSIASYVNENKLFVYFNDSALNYDVGNKYVVEKSIIPEPFKFPKPTKNRGLAKVELNLEDGSLVRTLEAKQEEMDDLLVSPRLFDVERQMNVVLMVAVKKGGISFCIRGL